MFNHRFDILFNGAKSTPCLRVQKAEMRTFECYSAVSKTLNSGALRFRDAFSHDTIYVYESLAVAFGFIFFPRSHLPHFPCGRTQIAAIASQFYRCSGYNLNVDLMVENEAVIELDEPSCILIQIFIVEYILNIFFFLF